MTAPNPYRTPARLRGYNGRVTADGAHGGRDAFRVFRLYRPGTSRAFHVRRAASYAAAVERLGRAYAAALDAAALATWGRPWRATDYRVSGIGSEDFAETARRRLRTLAHARTRCAARAALHAHAARYGRR